MAERLTSLIAVKEWLGIDPDLTDSDVTLTRLIDAASQHVLNFVNRSSFAPAEYTMNFRGNGHSSMLLRNWPVISIASVGIGGVALPASPSVNNGMPQSGYLISDRRDGPQSLELYGYSYWLGAPTRVVYRAGWEETQSFSIVAATEIVTTKGGQWISDGGVVKGGVAMTRVEGVPAAGQYAVDDWGSYTFNNADAGQSVIITFGYVPPIISFAVTEMIGEWYKRKDRIGILSKTLGGQETITFSKTDMSDLSRTALNQYKNVTPS